MQIAGGPFCVDLERQHIGKIFVKKVNILLIYVEVTSFLQ